MIVSTIIFSFISFISVINYPVSELIQHQKSDEFNVEIINLEELNDIIITRQGKPLLLNVWATWCIPCREEFPDLMRMAEDYDDEIEVIGISVDLPEEIESKVIPFLQQVNTSFNNYIIEINDPEDFINFMNQDWSGAIPATFIYDKTGAQEEVFIGKQSFNDFEEAIKSYLSSTE
jgi:thiol-disulfide isomerase/thioredoxin